LALASFSSGVISPNRSRSSSSSLSDMSSSSAAATHSDSV